MMILFLISFLMVFVSSYLLASIFEVKKYLTGIIYTLLIAFAQIIVTIEFLSLFKFISKVGILSVNFIILAISIFIWLKMGKPLYKLQFKQFFINVLKAIKKDKMLAVMALGFVFFILVSLFLCWLAPVIAYDSLAYHFNRAVAWASQGSLAHFDIGDDRNINMAINSEILYTWFLTFVPRNIFIGFFNFAGYVLAVCSLYSFLEICGFCMRKRLWAVFLMSTLSGVLTEASGVETNTTMGALALGCVALFLLGLKKNSLIPVYFSSLAISIAVGTKTTAFFMIPIIGLIFVYFLLKYQKAQFWRYSGVFFGFSIFNVIIFSAYNYVLNYLDFGHVMGSSGTILYHQMTGGVKGYISGVIRHLVLLLDFTGFSYGFYLEKYVFAVQDKLLTLLNIPLDLNVISSNKNQLNFTLNDSLSGGGVVGTFVLIPCAVVAMFRGLLDRKADKSKMLALFGLVPFLSILVMSACIGFMLYSSRFLISFFVLASPIFVISYIKSNKNIFKYLILFYVMSYFILISTHIWSRHFVRSTAELVKGTSIRDFRTKNLCSLNFYYNGRMPFCDLRSYLSTLPKGSRIGLFTSVADKVAIIKLMENDGYKVDFMLTEKTHLYDLKAYDYLVYTGFKTTSTYIALPKETVENYYVKDNTLHFVDENKARCILLHEKGKSVLITKENYDDVIASSVSCTIPYEILEKNGFYKIMRILYGELDDETQKPLDELNEFVIFKR